MVTHGKKGYRLWVVTNRKDRGNREGKIYRDIYGKIDLLKVSFHLYCFTLYNMWEP